MTSLTADTLTAHDFVTVEVLLKSKSAAPIKASLVVFRFADQVYAYVNHCMHMHRPLNCQQDAIFDTARRWLRCSMHGFLFEPTNGVCISPVCEGQALQKINVVEEDGLIVFKEKQLQVLAVHLPANNPALTPLWLSFSRKRESSDTNGLPTYAGATIFNRRLI